VVAPFVRPAATDLNVPLAIALISVVWTQIIGVQALGGSYFRKFFLPHMTGMKAIDLIVGLLELVSEFAKIVSFTFRLFGNIFAGVVLLFVMSFLVPFFVPLPFYILELFVGFMQAFVFAILTLIFMSMATVGHGPDHDHH
jgi:F-type H+-transporting ATPase subunit a